jgi:hypothetical protein
MRYTQDDLDRARGHVEDGERMVAEQQERIQLLRTNGSRTDDAIILLAHMRLALEDARRHRDEIAKNIGSR